MYLLGGHAAAGACLLLAARYLGIIRRHTHPNRGFFVSTMEEARHLLFAFDTGDTYGGLTSSSDV